MPIKMIEKIKTPIKIEKIKLPVKNDTGYESCQRPTNQMTDDVI
jgi:hypothetical protein